MDLTLITGNCFGDDGLGAAILIGALLGLAAGLYRPRRAWLSIRRSRR